MPVVEFAFGAALLALGVVAALALNAAGLEWARPMGIDLAAIGPIALIAMSGVAAARLVAALLPELPMRFEDGAVVPFPRGAVRAIHWSLASHTIVVEFCWPLDDPCRMKLEVARVADGERLLAMFAHVGVTPYEAPLPDATWLRMTRPLWLPPRVASPQSRRAIRFPGRPRVHCLRARRRLPRATWHHTPLRSLGSRLLPTRDRWCPPRARRRW